MRITEINQRKLITESWNDPKLSLLESRVIIPFVEDIERFVVEAQLSPDQINQLFTSAEQGMTAGGKNRTMLGKGKDAASFINQKINDLGKAIQNTGPVKNLDAKFADAMKKIDTSDSKVAKAVQGVKQWATDNPGKASIAVAIITAAAAFSGGPMAGAVGGFLARATKDILQGEKLSTAVGKSTKTAAIGAVAGALGDVFADTDIPEPEFEGGPAEVEVTASSDEIASSGGEEAASAIAEMTEEQFKEAYAREILERQAEKFNMPVTDAMVQKIADNVEITGNYPDDYNAGFEGTFVRGTTYLTPEEAQEYSRIVQANGGGTQGAFSQEANEFIKDAGGAGPNVAPDGGTDPETGANEPKGGTDARDDPDFAPGSKPEDFDSMDPADKAEALIDVPPGQWTAEDYALMKSQDMLTINDAQTYFGNKPELIPQDARTSMVKMKQFLTSELGGEYDNASAFQRSKIAKYLLQRAKLADSVDYSDIDLVVLAEKQDKQAQRAKPVKAQAEESKTFTSLQVETLIEWCDDTPEVLTEGPMDALKKAGSAIGGAIKKGAAAVGAKAAQVGKNMTTKVTADKLNKAWNKAGKPTDSDEIANILRQAGVSDNVLAPIYKQFGAKLPPAPKPTEKPAQGTAAKPAQGTAAPGKEPAAAGGPGTAPAQGNNTPAGQSGAPAQDGAAPAQGGGQPATAAGPTDFKGIQQAVAKLNPQQKQELIKHIDSLGQQGAAPAQNPAQDNAQPAQNAQNTAQGATNTKTAPTADKNAAANDTYEKAKGDIRKVQGGTKPMPPKTAAAIDAALAKLAKGDKESGVFAAQKIMNFAKAGVDVSKQQQAWLANSKAGERFLTQSIYFEINKMIREHGLRWSDLGLRVHLLEGTNAYIGISQI